MRNHLDDGVDRPVTAAAVVQAHLDLDILESRVARVKVDGDLLLRALALADHDSMIEIARRLRAGLGEVERTALGRAVCEPERYDEIVSRAVQLDEQVRPLLELVIQASRDPVEVRRYLARMGAACLSRYRESAGGAVSAPNETLADLVLKHADLQHARLDGATLRNVIAHEANCAGVFAPGITMLRVDLWGSCLRGATLDTCRAADSCLATATLTDAAMAGATVTRCDLRAAVLRDVDLTRAAFIACDFRGATFETGARDASAEGAQFIRCDLRGTSWGGRDLGGVRFEDCKLASLRGRPRTEGVVVVRPDLSATGHGPAGAPPSSPELLWLGVP